MKHATSFGRIFVRNVNTLFIFIKRISQSLVENCLCDHAQHFCNSFSKVFCVSLNEQLSKEC